MTPSWQRPAIRPRAEAILEETKEKYKGQYILAVEGNPPLNNDGMFCIDGGKPFVEKLKWMAADASFRSSDRNPERRVPLPVKVGMTFFGEVVEKCKSGIGFGLAPVFETARMYSGPIRPVAVERVFGVTTFELG